MNSEIKDKALAAKRASIELAAADTAVKNSALLEIAASLKANSSKIIEANNNDLKRAERNSLEKPLLKRLKFDENKIEDVCKGIESLADIDEPVGKTLDAIALDDGLELYKVSCPIGVIGVIFESRPDALVQISSLCLKSGNAVLLKGGSEAAETNKALAEIIAAACKKAGAPDGWIGLLETRQDVSDMLSLDEYIDLIVPRGSNEFVKYIMNNTNIAVLGHSDGICHGFIDAGADLDMAVNLAFDSKCQYPSVCNAMETLLVHKDIAGEFLPKVKAAYEKANVELRGCEKTRAIIEALPADEKDWKTEYLDYVLSIKIVDSLTEAVAHINKYGSGHTDMIVTADREAAKKFMALVDSGDVFWNASTRFSDGYRYGLGAEVGISTNKIHARGPVGIEGLLIYKWNLIGNGQTVADFSRDGSRKFKHCKLDKKFEL